MTDNQSAIHSVDYRSEHLTFRSLWHAATVLRDAGMKDDGQGYWMLMASAVMAYTAFEGFTNDLLERLHPDIWKQRRSRFSDGSHRGTMGKVHFLAEQLGVALARTEPPYSTVAELRAWRNSLVHPETVRISGTMRADAYSLKPRHAVPTPFVVLQRPDFVSHCFQDVPALADVLLSAARAKHAVEVRELGDVAFSGVMGSSGASLRS